MKVVSSIVVAVVLFIGSLILFGGCSDRTRYECQKEENWRNESCSLPMCRIEDKCTTDLLGSVP